MVSGSVTATFGFYLWQLSSGAPFALVQTETFTLLVVCQWFNVLNCRSSTSSCFHLDTLKNHWLTGGLVLGNLFQVLVIYAGPMNRIFHTVPIPLEDFFLIGLVGSIVLWVEEIRKMWSRWHSRKKARATGGAVIPSPASAL